MNNKTQPRTLTKCPGLLLDIMRKCRFTMDWLDNNDNSTKLLYGTATRKTILI